MDPNTPTQPGRNGGKLKRGGSPGRRKGSFNLEKLLRELMEENKGELGRAYAKAQILLAMKGNGVAIKEINGRLAGPITEKHESSGEIRVIYENGDRDKTAEVSPSTDGSLVEPEEI